MVSWGNLRAVHSLGNSQCRWNRAVLDDDEKLSLAAALCMMSCASQPTDFDSRVDYALDYVVSQLKKSVESIDDPDKFARTNNPDGSWKTVGMYD